MAASINCHRTKEASDGRDYRKTIDSELYLRMQSRRTLSIESLAHVRVIPLVVAANRDIASWQQIKNSVVRI